MAVVSRIKQNTYVDSLVLMRAASKVRELPGIKDAVILMGTPQNKEILASSDLLTPEVKAAGSDDLFFVVDAVTDGIGRQAIDEAEKAVFLLSATSLTTNASDIPRFRSLQGALNALPGANLTLLSIPGHYVKEEALRALNRGLNLMIFSDNVPIEDEIVIKRTGQEQGLLVMGPDCGTALIAGAGLGFANQVKRGHIGIVGASGTGIQEVTCLVDRWGLGISHAIGTGGRDIKAEVGAITMQAGIDLLASDEDTKVIVVISKPPPIEIQRLILDRLATISKPAVLLFQGARDLVAPKSSVHFAKTLAEAAELAVNCCGGSVIHETNSYTLEHKSFRDTIAALKSSQTLVRGIFVGGTFCNEAAGILLEEVGDVYTNTGLPGAHSLHERGFAEGHACIDMGDDEFTRGRPHPMLEPIICRDRIISEATNPRIAVLLLDMVLGYGAHLDPAGIIIPFLKEAREKTAKEGRCFIVVAHVCGTEGDPQVRSKQVEQLRDAGVLIPETNAAAVHLACRIAKRHNVF